jgi:hypothetical protein
MGGLKPGKRLLCSIKAHHSLPIFLTITLPNRGSSFRKDKLNGFLDVMAQVKPVGGEEWNEVCHLHNKNFPSKHRTADTLHRKFQMMYLLKPPTGNQTISPKVSQAKLSNNEIKLKANIDDGEGSGDEKSTEESEFVPDVEDVLDKEEVLVTESVLVTAGENATKNVDIGKTATEPTDDDLYKLPSPKKPNMVFSTPLVRPYPKTPSSGTDATINSYLRVMMTQKDIDREEHRQQLLRQEARDLLIADEERNHCYKDERKYQQQQQFLQQQQQSQQQMMNTFMTAVMSSSSQQSNPTQQLLSMIVANRLRSPIVETQHIVAPGTAVASNIVGTNTVVQPPMLPNQIDLSIPKRSPSNLKIQAAISIDSESS